MNAVIQDQYIHALFRFILFHELKQFPVKIPQIHNINRLVMGGQKRDHAVGIGILDDKQCFPRVISGMNFYECMIVIQEKGVLIFRVQIIRCIQRICSILKIIRNRHCFFSVSGKY